MNTSFFSIIIGQIQHTALEILRLKKYFFLDLKFKFDGHLVLIFSLAT